MPNNDTKPLINNRVIVSIVRDDSGKVLIVKRKNEVEIIDGGKLTWTFPSRVVDDSPSLPIIMAHAEDSTLKTAGYKVKAMDKISERHYYPLGNHLTYIHCTLISSTKYEIKDDEIETHEWVDPIELNNYFTSSIDLGVAEFLGL